MTQTQKLSRTQRSTSFGLTFCKEIAINVLFCCFLLISRAVSYRSWRYFRDFTKICDSSYFTRLDAFSRNTFYGFTGPDQIVGHSLVDGTFKIREPDWNNATITIRKGVRVEPKLSSSNSTDGA